MRILFKLLLTLALSLIVTAQATRTRWQFLPTNTNITSGLVFHFEGRVAATATVTVDSKEDGKASSLTKEIPTDSTFGAAFFKMPINNLDHFQVVRIKIWTGDYAAIVESPKAGEYYQLEASR